MFKNEFFIGSKKGEANMYAKLTEREVLSIRSLRKKDKKYWSQTRLGKKFNVGQTTISKVIRRASWSHL